MMKNRVVEHPLLQQGLIQQFLETYGNCISPLSLGVFLVVYGWQGMRLMIHEQGDLSIEGYLNRFMDLLPYDPRKNPFAKYSHFLGGLNHENFDQVIECDDLNSFEDFVNHCRQVENYISWKSNVQVDQSSSSLRSRGHSLKKRSTVEDVINMIGAEEFLSLFSAWRDGSFEERLFTA